MNTGPPSKGVRLVFWAAGIYGLIVVPPLYFLECQFAKQAPPAITHPEFYYGFAGVTFAWQMVYLLVAGDPVRYRPVMLLGALGKALYGTAAVILYAQDRLAASTFGFSMVDLIFAALFLASYQQTRASDSSGAGAPQQATHIR